jgi:hypothetical protein
MRRGHPPWPSSRAPAPGADGVGGLPTAIDRALAALPVEGERRIVVFTRGDALGAEDLEAVRLARLIGVPVSVVSEGFEPPQALYLARLDVPPVVYEGDAVQVRAWVRNPGEATEATLVLGDEDSVFFEEAMQFGPGTTVLELPYRGAGAEPHLITARVRGPASDALVGGHPEAVERARVRGLSGVLSVAGRARVLVVTPDRATVLGSALGVRDIEVEFRAPAARPRTLAELMDFECVVLSGLDAGELHAAEASVWRQYVEVLGRGLVIVGGPATFRPGPRPLNALLPLAPVAAPPPGPQPDRIALMLVIDRSNSMGDNSLNDTLRDGQKMRFAKIATLGVVEQLRDDDLVGVIAFDSRPHMVARLAPLRLNRHTIRDRVQRLNYAGTTDFHASLGLAHEELADASPDHRHVLLLTDGTGLVAHDYGPLLEALRADGVTVTTIRIGTDDADLDLLARIAATTGGSFHHIADAVKLPKVVLTDTTARQRATPRPRRRVREIDPPEFIVRSGVAHAFLRGIDATDLPLVSRLATTRARAGARVPLEVDVEPQRYPLVGIRRLGLGQVVAVAAPLDRLETWAASEQVAKFWSQLVRSVIRDDAIPLRAWGRQRAGGTELVVEVDDAAVEAIGAEILPGAGRGPTSPAALVTFTSERPGRYRATATPPLAAGLHVARFTLHRRGRETRSTHLLRVGEEAPLGEWTRPDAELLPALARAGGGGLDPEAASLFEPRRQRERLVSLDTIVVSLAVLLLLADIGIRELVRPVLA